jgi:hypothetical protein
MAKPSALSKGTECRPCNGVLFSVDDAKTAVTDLREHGVAFNDDGEIEEPSGRLTASCWPSSGPHATVAVASYLPARHIAVKGNSFDAPPHARRVGPH